MGIVAFFLLWNGSRGKKLGDILEAIKAEIYHERNICNFQVGTRFESRSETFENFFVFDLILTRLSYFCCSSMRVFFKYIVKFLNNSNKPDETLGFMNVIVILKVREYRHLTQR